MDWELLSGILNIIIINLVLSGDNAVVIAMAAKGLPEVYRKKAIFWGASLAVVLRIGLTFVAALLLKVPFIQLVGGLLLAWIAFKLLKPHEETVGDQQASGDFKKALLTILWADLLMSLDNVLAVAGASGGNFFLLAFGIAISIPIVLVGSSLLTKLMEKFPWISYLGAGVLAYTAGEMIVEDKAIAPVLHAIPYGEVILPITLIVVVLMAGRFTKGSELPAEEKA